MVVHVKNHILHSDIFGLVLRHTRCSCYTHVVSDTFETLGEKKVSCSIQFLL